MKEAHIKAAGTLLEGRPLPQVAGGGPTAPLALPEQAPRPVQVPPEGLHLCGRLKVQQRPSVICTVISYCLEHLAPLQQGLLVSTLGPLPLPGNHFKQAGRGNYLPVQHHQL